MILLATLAWADDYAHHLQGEVREATVYQHAYAAMILRAVHVDADLLARQADEVTRLGGTPDVAPMDALTVVFGAYTHWKDEMRVSGDGSTPWVAKAWVGEHECTLLDVTQTRAISPWHRALYPFLSRWDSLWTARFDPTCGDGPLRFALMGPRGRAEVHWD